MEWRRFRPAVLHYRGLIHGIQAPRYWDMGEDDREFKWNNYISRYHTRHLDLMDLMALYQARANAPLDGIAQLCGFPGKLGMDGSKVWDAYKNGEIEAIRNYCETDAANTSLVFLALPNSCVARWMKNPTQKNRTGARNVGQLHRKTLARIFGQVEIISFIKETYHG